MMRFFSAVLLLMLTGCVKNFDLKLDKTAPLIVIEGRISDLRGPYYVRITRSSNVLGIPYAPFGPDSAVAVKGALVTISDDMGVTDTLKPSVKRNPPRYIYTSHNGTLDSFLRVYYNEYYTNELGYYETTKLTGVPGHTYQLKVRVDDKEFHASAYMPFVTGLDSAVLKEPANAGWGHGETLPYVYFKEPQPEKNYYLLQHNNIADYPYDNPYGSSVTSILTPYYVVDDKILPPYVNGLSVWEIWPNTPYGYTQTYVFPGDPLQVRLSSLTKEVYGYFKALGNQFENDGNVYKPAPASAVGNIDGGALGLFWATSVSYKLILPQ
jgi:hypothetical protein